MLRATSLSFQIPNAPLFSNLNLCLQAGSLNCVLGPNGSGKSTLIRALARILPLKHGSLYYNELDLTKLSIKQLAKYVAYIPQNIPEAPLTVQQVLLMGRSPYIRFMPSKKDVAKVEEMLLRFDICAWRNRYIDELSGGERQKVFLAKALVQETPILLLDEPTNNLDIYYQLEIYELLRKICLEDKKIVLIAEHNLNLATRFSDKLIIMHQGNFFAQGSPKEVLNEKLLQTVYNIYASINYIDDLPNIIINRC